MRNAATYTRTVQIELNHLRVGATVDGERGGPPTYCQNKCGKLSAFILAFGKLFHFFADIKTCILTWASFRGTGPGPPPPRSEQCLSYCYLSFSYSYSPSLSFILYLWLWWLCCWSVWHHSRTISCWLFPFCSMDNSSSSSAEVVTVFVILLLLHNFTLPPSLSSVSLPACHKVYPPPPTPPLRINGHHRTINEAHEFYAWVRVDGGI